jgi:hypothetical protein
MARQNAKHGEPSEVETLLAALDHPQRDLIDALRRAILAAHPSIEEGVKWNAPSYRTREWFATLNLRGPRGPSPVRLILHLGAKARDTRGFEVDDPEGLLEWKGADRASVAFDDAADLRRKRKALTAILQQWVAFV